MNLIIRLSFFVCLALIRSVDYVWFKKRRDVVFKHDYAPLLSNQDKAIMIVIFISEVRVNGRVVVM